MFTKKKELEQMNGVQHLMLQIDIFSSVIRNTSF